MAETGTDALPGKRGDCQNHQLGTESGLAIILLHFDPYTFQTAKWV